MVWVNCDIAKGNFVDFLLNTTSLRLGSGNHATSPLCSTSLIWVSTQIVTDLLAYLRCIYLVQYFYRGKTLIFQDLHVVKLLSASHPTGTQCKILTLKPDKLLSSILCQSYLNISCVRESIEPRCFLNRGVWRGYVKVFGLICHDSTSRVGLIILLSWR